MQALARKDNDLLIFELKGVKPQMKYTRIVALTLAAALLVTMVSANALASNPYWSTDQRSKADFVNNNPVAQWTQTNSESCTAQVGESLHLNNYWYNTGTSMYLTGYVKMWKDSDSTKYTHTCSQILSYGQGYMEESAETPASGSLNQQRTLNNLHYYKMPNGLYWGGESGTGTSNAKKFTIINY